MALTKVKLIADGVITSANLDASHGITTSDIGEGSNLYYTDARVSSYLSTNGFATQTDIVAAITDSAPVTLDTLNELAAALGDDPNFATTTATSLGLKAPLASPSFTGNATFAGNVLVGSGTIDNPQGWGKVLQVQNSGANGASLSVKDSNNEWNLATYNGVFYISDGVEERLTIDSSGATSFAGSASVSTAVASIQHLSSNGYLYIKGGSGGLIIGDDSTSSRIQIEDNSNIRFETAGAERMRIDSSGRLGIGGSPSTFANFTNVTIQGGSSGSNLDFKNSSGTRVSAIVTTASNELIIETGTAQPMIFKTNDTERMRIDSSGAITTDVTGEVTIPFYVDGYRTGVQQIWLNNSRAANSSNGRGTKLILGAGNTIGAYFTHYTSGSTGNGVLDIGVQYTGVTTQSGLEFNTNSNRTVIKSVGSSAAYTSFESSDGTEKMRILSGGGITFNGDTAAANALDDYEEGTWTPDVHGSTTRGTPSYQYRSGSYTKIGNRVWCRFGFKLSSISGATGRVRVDGLPFTSRSYGSYQEPNFSPSTGLLATTANAYRARMFVVNNSSYLEGRISVNTDTIWDISDFGGDEWIILAFHYETHI